MLRFLERGCGGGAGKEMAGKRRAGDPGQCFRLLGGCTCLSLTFSPSSSSLPKTERDKSSKLLLLKVPRVFASWG